MAAALIEPLLAGVGRALVGDAAGSAAGATAGGAVKSLAGNAAASAGNSLTQGRRASFDQGTSEVGEVEAPTIRI